MDIEKDDRAITRMTSSHLELNQYHEAKGTSIQYCGRFVRYDFYVYLGVGTSC